LEYKVSRSLFYLVSIGLLIRVSIAIWNGFFGPSFGAGLDAAAFHLKALEYSQNLTLETFKIGWIYSYILGVVYSITSDSLFLGSMLSCITWVFSASFLIKILKLLSLNKRSQYWVILIYTFLPSSLMYTSVTLREVYQLLFVNMIIYAALMIILKKTPRYWWILLIGVIGAGSLHGGLMAFGIVSIALTLFFSSTSKKGNKSFIKLIIALPFIFLVLFYGINFIQDQAFNLEEGITNAISHKQEGALKIDARAMYKFSVNISGAADLITFIPMSLIQYLFEPAPWRISSIIDIPVFLENLLRFWLIWHAIKSLRNAPSSYYRPVLFCFLSYLALETIWSIGTINWGTASRHHIPSIGILLALAFFNLKKAKA